MKGLIKKILREQTTLLVEQPQCPPNGRSVVADNAIATSCLSGFPLQQSTSYFNSGNVGIIGRGCITVNNGNVPQMGDIVYFDFDPVQGQPMYFKISSVAPSNTSNYWDWDTVPAVGCGYDCNTKGECIYNGSGNAEYPTEAACQQNCRRLENIDLGGETGIADTPYTPHLPWQPTELDPGGLTPKSLAPDTPRWPWKPSEIDPGGLTPKSLAPEKTCLDIEAEVCDNSGLGPKTFPCMTINVSAPSQGDIFEEPNPNGDPIIWRVISTSPGNYTGALDYLPANCPLNESNLNRIIKKILREQASDDATRRLRIVFSQMKTIKEVDEYIVGINKEKKQPYGFEHIRDAILGILKLVGRIETSYVETADMTYWFAKAFLLNGGYGRNFKEGEIQLVELPVYGMECNYTEEVFEFRTGWGDVIGVTSEEEAIDIFGNDAENYIEDSESDDSDYGDIYNVEGVVVNETRWIKFKPEWIGL